MTHQLEKGLVCCTLGVGSAAWFLNLHLRDIKVKATNSPIFACFHQILC